MDTLVLKVDPKIKEKLLWLLSHFHKDEIAIELDIESIPEGDEDRKYFQELRNEEFTPLYEKCIHAMNRSVIPCWNEF